MNKKTILLNSIILAIIVTSCRPNKQLTEYVLNTQIQSHPTGMITSSHYDILYKGYDRKNESYLEIAKYKYMGKTKLLLTSTVFYDYLRFNILTGFQRRPYVDTRQNVYYITLNKSQCDSLIKFSVNKELIDSIRYNKDRVDFNFNLNKDLFISINSRIAKTSILDRNTNSKVASLKVENKLYLWLKFRKHAIDFRQFNDIIRKNSKDLD